jgi:hypothetical protein
MTFLAFGHSDKEIGRAVARVDVKGGARAAYSREVFSPGGFGDLVFCDRIAQIQGFTLVTCDQAAAVNTDGGSSPGFGPL